MTFMLVGVSAVVALILFLGGFYLGRRAAYKEVEENDPLEDRFKVSGHLM